MRVRIKFSKRTPMQYIGHLDTMRYFQKVLRRAGLPVAFSEGFSPHILMSFASPLGVGRFSEGEYFDLELKDSVPCTVIADAMQRQLTPGFAVTAVSEIDSSKMYNGMRSIAAAAYHVESHVSIPVSEERIQAFMEKRQIEVLRKTKRKEEVTDIRPWIYDFSGTANGFDMMLSAGSVSNLKPELVVHAYAKEQGLNPDTLSLQICRMDLYANAGTQETPVWEPLWLYGCIDREGVYHA